MLSPFLNMAGYNSVHEGVRMSTLIAEDTTKVEETRVSSYYVQADSLCLNLSLVNDKAFWYSEVVFMY